MIFGQKKLQKVSQNKLGSKNKLYHEKELEKLRPGQKLDDGPWQYIA